MMRYITRLEMLETYLKDLQKSTEVATGGLHNAMPKFLGSMGIKVGFRQADSVHSVVPKEFERGMNVPKQQLSSTFVTVTNSNVTRKWGHLLNKWEELLKLYTTVFSWIFVDARIYNFLMLRCLDDSCDEQEKRLRERRGSSDKEEDEEKLNIKTIKETTYEWERLNDVKAIWLRNPEVAEEEYTKFYHSLAKDFGDEKPMAWSHFNAEGDVEFKAVLFVPPKAPTDLYESYYNANKSNLKLYVGRVFHQGFVDSHPTTKCFS
ncbi:endoplasmin [Artemisia annua]|uniref:Endoplasmin n=1 Tax=Artemisia annua TaxID=35608 RepID=A0A2U1PLZ9_ARTAN|nr:endoplasmin [Artemisia annua]